MKLLVLGGTVFVGRQIIEEALAKDHEVTLFHRGQRGAELFEGRVERLIGDRDGGLDALAGREWDAVVDTCGYVPRVVRQSAELLRGSTARYLFISTISVYETVGADRIVETSPLKSRPADPATEVVDGDTYGPLKVMCEEVVNELYGSGATIIRPGVIVGPNDPTDRFTYWVLRMHRGGEVLVPDRRDQPCQVIDVRDLAKFCVSLIENNVAGTFNVVPPEKPLGDLLEICRGVANPEAELVWVSPAKLEELGVKPWSELPLYLGPDPGDDALERTDSSRAVAEGLQFTPLEQTSRATLDWALARGEVELRAGLKPEREREILDQAFARP